MSFILIKFVYFEYWENKDLRAGFIASSPFLRFLRCAMGPMSEERRPERLR